MTRNYPQWTKRIPQMNKRCRLHYTQMAKRRCSSNRTNPCPRHLSKTFPIHNSNTRRATQRQNKYLSGLIGFRLRQRRQSRARRHPSPPGIPGHNRMTRPINSHSLTLSRAQFACAMHHRALAACCPVERHLKGRPGTLSATRNRPTPSERA